jgi:hypothetical protein
LGPQLVSVAGVAGRSRATLARGVRDWLNAKIGLMGVFLA